MFDDVKRLRLSKNDSIFSTDKDKSFNLPIESTFRKISNTNLISAVDLNQLFENERSACTKHRIVLTINPFCTNVLFNACTEIVKNEGSYNQEPILDLEDTRQDIQEAYGKRYVVRNEMVSNTEYSRESLKYSYHPGIDIFNNHILRNKTSKIVNLYNIHNIANKDVFNTISDYTYDYDGELNKFTPRKSLTESMPPLIKRHLYTMKDVMSFENMESIDNNLTVENGWYGFNNTTVIEAKDATNKKLDINRVINNKGNCEFVDMYPDRTLFLFSPKKNKEKKRLEYNWDIEFTYPYRNFYSHPLVNDGVFEGGDKKWLNGSLNAMLLMSVEYKTMPNGSLGLCFRSCVKHGLSVGSYFKLYYYLGCGGMSGFMECDDECCVSILGDDDNKNEEYFFSVSGRNALNDIIGNVILSPDCGFYIENQNPSNVEIYTQLGSKLKTVPFFIKNNEEKYKHIRFYEYIAESKQSITYDDSNTYQELPRIITNDMPMHIRVIGDNVNFSYYIKTEKFYDMEEGIENDDDIISIINSVLSSSTTQFRYKRVVSGVESEYYFRIFKKIPNWKFSSENLTSDYVDNGVVFENFIEKNAKDINGHMYKFDNEYYDLAFAKTIYNDTITQISYTDDIDIANLKDNRGRPLTSIFTTIVKKNCGYEKWYSEWDKDKDYGSDDVEYSHCFGKVTSGVPFFAKNGDLNNVKVMDYKYYFSDARVINNVGDIPGYNPLSLEHYIGKTDTIDGISDDEFFGDIVDFNPVDAFENTLEDVYMRFNTAQREAWENEGQYVLHISEIMSDDYDLQKFGGNSTNVSDTFDVEDTPYTYAFVRPEGYYYKAHYEIMVRELGVKHQDSHYRLNVKECKMIFNEIENIEFISIRTRSKHKSFSGDTVFFCNDATNVWYKTRIVYTIDDYTILCSVISEEEADYIAPEDMVSMINEGILKIRVKNYDIPDYAVRVNTNDFIWRDINKNGDSRNKLMKEYPFTNGAFYIDNQINFFLKRQDPDGVNGLYFHSPNEIFANPEGRVIKNRNIDYVEEERMLC